MNGMETGNKLFVSMRYDHNLLLLWFFLIFQILILMCYLKYSSTWNNKSQENGEKLPISVQFVQDSNRNVLEKKMGLTKFKTYYSVDDGGDVLLKTENVQDYFVNVNNMICFKYGTDVKQMKRNSEKKETEKCDCLTGYHGNDCSLPEVIWRAFIAFGRETVIHKRNSQARRIIHMFQISHPAEIPLAVIKINELFHIVDLFLVLESNRTEYGEAKPFDFKLKLDKGLLGDKQYKILHVPVQVGRRDAKTPNEISWGKSRRMIKNLRDDDLFIQLGSSEIPSPKALLFFKLYDGFSLPLQFRLKWNVYGYFFQHPNKTKKITTGSTVRMLGEVFKNNPDLIQNTRGLVIGDLNHYGGWFCDLCHDPKDILNVVQNFNQFEESLSKVTKVIDAKYLEEIISDGLYVDGKTILIPNHEDREAYYAPDYVTTNFWQFDSLMINLYSKIDYD